MTLFNGPFLRLETFYYDACFDGVVDEYLEQDSTNFNGSIRLSLHWRKTVCAILSPQIGIETT